MLIIGLLSEAFQPSLADPVELIEPMSAGLRNNQRYRVRRGARPTMSRLDPSRYSAAKIVTTIDTRYGRPSVVARIQTSATMRMAMRTYGMKHKFFLGAAIPSRRVFRVKHSPNEEVA